MAALVLVAAGPGCGAYMARRLAQAPNTFPQWVAPKKAPVVLDISANFVTNFPAQFVEVGPPPARLQYRVTPPGDYAVKASSSNWVEHGHHRFQFRFRATVPPPGSERPAPPRGTVVLLHGYGLSHVSMAPWALRLAQEGWQCVMVDLRGHGRSTGQRIYFGKHEVTDLSQLLDALQQQGKLAVPIVAFGQSYGAALALRWPAADTRIQRVVAVAPYAELATAVLSIRHQYAPWMPKCCIQAGLNKLPKLLEMDAAEFDPVHWVARHSVPVLFIAGASDSIAPAAGVSRLYDQAAPGSRLLVVPQSPHEPLPFLFSKLVPPVLDWLNDRATVSLGDEK